MSIRRTCWSRSSNDEGRAAGPGETGRILVTLLTNLGFPMIRYEIGDLGAWADPGPCPCGRPFPRLRGVEGRLDDMLTTPEGTRLTSGFVRHFVGVSLNRQLVREWRFEQTGPANYVWSYVPASTAGLDENLRQVEAALRHALGAGAEVKLEAVDAIEREVTGKMRWVVNRHASTLGRSESSVDARSG